MSSFFHAFPVFMCIFNFSDIGNSMNFVQWFLTLNAGAQHLYLHVNRHVLPSQLQQLWEIYKFTGLSRCAKAEVLREHRRLGRHASKDADSVADRSFAPKDGRPTRGEPGAMPQFQPDFFRMPMTPHVWPSVCQTKNANDSKIQSLPTILTRYPLVNVT